jgi:hypothetical protein
VGSENSSPGGECVALDRVRLGAVEIAIYAAELPGVPTVFPLCIVISFIRGCYVCHMPRRLGRTSVSLTIFRIGTLQGSEGFEIIFANVNGL